MLGRAPEEVVDELGCEGDELGVLGEGNPGMLWDEPLLEGMLGILIGDGRLGGGVIGAHAGIIDPTINGSMASEDSRLRDL